jgi:hypothetical protein
MVRMSVTNRPIYSLSHFIVLIMSIFAAVAGFLGKALLDTDLLLREDAVMP